LPKFISLGLASIFSTSLFAAIPPVPEVTTAGFINGNMNLGIWHKTIPYKGSGVTTLQNAVTLTCSYQIEMRDTSEDEWTDVTSKGIFRNYEKNKFIFKTWTLPTNLYGSAQFRIRSIYPDTTCAELDYILGEGRIIDTEYAMTNNFAFGGVNTSLIFKKI
jgi:hypothetical protein